MDRQLAARLLPGQSSNPTGRPPGSKTKTTLLAEAILDAQLLHRQRRTRETIEFGARLAALDGAVGLGRP